MAASGTYSLVLIDDAIANSMNSKIYKVRISAEIQPNALKPTVWCLTLQMGKDLVKDTECSKMPPELNLTENVLYLLEAKQRGSEDS